VTDGYGSTSTMYRRIVFWTDLTFSRRSQHAYAVKQKGQLVGWRLSVSSSERRDVRHQPLRSSLQPSNFAAALPKQGWYWTALTSGRTLQCGFFLQVAMPIEQGVAPRLYYRAVWRTLSGRCDLEGVVVNLVDGVPSLRTSGQAAAALPRSATKLRRLMQYCPRGQSLPKGSVVRHSKIDHRMAEMGQSRRTKQAAIARCPLYLQDRPNWCVATK